MKLRLKLLLAVLVVVALVAGVVLMVSRSGRGDARALKLADSDDPSERLEGVEGLYGRAGRAVQGKLHQRCFDPDPKVARGAVLAVSMAPGGVDAAFLQRVLREAPSPEARGVAAAALGGVESVDLSVLTAALSDKEPAVRAGAALGLKRRGDKSTAPVLLQALDDPDREVRIAAISAINKLTGLRMGYEADAPRPERLKQIQGVRGLLSRFGMLGQKKSD